MYYKDNMFSTVIQAGGASTRMGRNKATMPVGGQPLIQYAIDRLSPISTEMLIIARDPSAFNDLKLPVKPDILADRGALGGLLSALTYSRHEMVISAACDMPFLSAKLFSHMAAILTTSGADVVIPYSEKGPEPMHALYRRVTCLPAVETALKQGQTRLVEWHAKVQVTKIPVEEVRKIVPDLSCFFNLNLPEDVVVAEQMLSNLKLDEKS